MEVRRIGVRNVFGFDFYKKFKKEHYLRAWVLRLTPWFQMERVYAFMRFEEEIRDIMFSNKSQSEKERLISWWEKAIMEALENGKRVKGNELIDDIIEEYDLEEYGIFWNYFRFARAHNEKIVYNNIEDFIRDCLAPIATSTNLVLARDRFTKDNNQLIISSTIIDFLRQLDKYQANGWQFIRNMKKMAPDTVPTLMVRQAEKCFESCYSNDPYYRPYTVSGKTLANIFRQFDICGDFGLNQRWFRFKMFFRPK